jgi:hypothetical protein
LQEAEAYTAQIYSIPSGAYFSRRDNPVLSALRIRPLLEAGGCGFRHRLCFSDDFLAGGNLTTIFPKLSWR